MKKAFPRIKALRVKFYPPTLVAVIKDDDLITEKPIPLFHLDEQTDVDELATQIIELNPEFQPKHHEKIESTLNQILEMQFVDHHNFYLQHLHKNHVMPINDCQFNKMGDLYVTSSDDRSTSRTTAAPHSPSKSTSRKTSRTDRSTDVSIPNNSDYVIVDVTQLPP